MITVIFLGLVGGLVTGITPCVLPVLPVLFLSGATGRDASGHRRSARPFLVVAGLVISFSAFTLLGTIVLDALHLPSSLIHWLGIVVLALIGIGLLVPAVERVLERPFSWIPQRAVGTDRGGFLLGLTLGAVYVPCAGPVLAAITVAGATGRIDASTVALTLAFAVGTAVPLLVFAVAGAQVADRVRAFRRRQRGIRIAAGVVVVALAAGLACNVTDVFQRWVPDYTQALDRSLQGEAAGADLGSSGGSGLNARINGCVTEASVLVVTSLRDCGTEPNISDITAWLNTPDGRAITRSETHGHVVLVDFWAYSCINCQRAIPHVEAWYQRYHDAGLDVIGVHSPEYSFEHDTANVQAGVDRLGITYPVALDNDLATWSAFANTSWPADYLIDATGTVRHVGIGEGDYAGTEKLIRRLLSAAHPDATLPATTDLPDTTPTNRSQTPETYLGAARARNVVGEDYSRGSRTFPTPGTLPTNSFALAGPWTVANESITAGSGGAASIALDYTASDVYLDVGGTGTLTVHTADGTTSTIGVAGAPDIRTIVSAGTARHGTVTVDLSPGLTAYSFTFG